MWWCRPCVKGSIFTQLPFLRAVSDYVQNHLNRWQFLSVCLFDNVYDYSHLNRLAILFRQFILCLNTTMKCTRPFHLTLIPYLYTRGKQYVGSLQLSPLCEMACVFSTYACINSFCCLTVTHKSHIGIGS